MIWAKWVQVDGRRAGTARGGHDELVLYHPKGRFEACSDVCLGAEHCFELERVVLYPWPHGHIACYRLMVPCLGYGVSRSLVGWTGWPVDSSLAQRSVVDPIEVGIDHVEPERQVGLWGRYRIVVLSSSNTM